MRRRSIQGVFWRRRPRVDNGRDARSPARKSGEENVTTKHVLTVVIALMSAAKSGPLFAQTPSWIIPDILTAAKAEGQVTVYSSTNEQEGLPLWKLYENATGIKVNYVRNAEGPMLSKIALEARTGQQSWDVQNAGSVNQIPSQLTLEWEPPLAREIMLEARDPAKRWHGVYAGYNAPQYNTNLVKADDLPKTYADFARHKEWNGRVVIEGTDREWMEAIFQHYGKDKGRALLEEIVRALNPIVLDGHLAMARQIAAGEYPVMLTNYTMLTTNFKQQGAPTDYLPLDPVSVWFGMVGVNKNAPHPNAAKLAANFLLSREAQSLSSKIGGRIPTRVDVESNPPDVRARLGEKKLIFMQLSAEQAKASQKTFDEIFRKR
jgi:iron(III) transport system substrate-binding protein